MCGEQLPWYNFVPPDEIMGLPFDEAQKVMDEYRLHTKNWTVRWDRKKARADKAKEMITELVNRCARCQGTGYYDTGIRINGVYNQNQRVCEPCTKALAFLKENP